MSEMCLVLPIPALSLTDLLSVLSTPSLASSSRMTEIFPHEYYAHDQIAGIDPIRRVKNSPSASVCPAPSSFTHHSPSLMQCVPIPHARPILGYSGKILGQNAISYHWNK
ncbi:hypothetical protein H4582DRAFT_1940347 [Lactarius indigo]|nr:hypothetical protein H4582DRAFT_1940347 [Lactarius indigo]